MLSPAKSSASTDIGESMGINGQFSGLGPRVSVKRQRGGEEGTIVTFNDIPLDELNEFVLIHSKQIYLIDVNTSLHACSDAGVEVPLRLPLRTYEQDLKRIGETNWLQSDWSNKAMKHKSARKKLSSSTRKQIYKQYLLGPDSLYFNEEIVSEDQLRVLCNLVTSVDVTRTLMFSDATNSQVASKQRKIAEKPQSNLTELVRARGKKPEKDALTVDEYKEGIKKFWHRCLIDKKYHDPNYEFGGYLRNKGESAVYERTRNAGAMAMFEREVWDYILYATLMPQEVKMMNAFFEVYGPDEIIRPFTAKKAVAEWAFNGNDEFTGDAKLDGGMDSKLITFLGAVLILSRSGLLTRKENDVLDPDMTVAASDYQFSFDGIHLRVAFVRELCNKIRSISVIPGAIILVGTYVCSAICRAYRYLSYLYEGFHVETDMELAFQRINEMDGETNILTRAIASAATIGLTPHNEALDLDQATERFDHEAIKHDADATAEFADEYPNLGGREALKVYANWQRGIAAAFVLVYQKERFQDQEIVETLKSVILMGIPGAKLALHRSVDIASFIDDGGDPGLECVNKVRQILGDDLWRLFASERTKHKLRGSGLLLNDKGGKEQIVLVQDRAIALWRSNTGVFKVVTSNLAPPKTMSVLKKFNVDPIPLESRSHEIWMALLKDEQSLRKIELLAAYKSLMLESTHFQHVIKEYSDIPIFYGGTDLTSVSEDIEWVANTFSIIFHILLSTGVDMDVFVTARSQYDWSRRGYVKFSEVQNIIREYRPDYVIEPDMAQYPSEELQIAKENFIGNLSEETSLIFLSPNSLAQALPKLSVNSITWKRDDLGNPLIGTVLSTVLDHNVPRNNPDMLPSREALSGKGISFTGHIKDVL